MRSEAHITGHRVGYRIALITLDAHAAGPCARAAQTLAADFPGWRLTSTLLRNGGKTKRLSKCTGRDTDSRYYRRKPSF